MTRSAPYGISKSRAQHSLRMIENEPESFATIRARAEARKGGSRALAALLPKPLSRLQLAKVGDDRLLSMMCKVVNQAGFNWTVIENKWAQFEEAFFKFDPEKLSSLSPGEWDNYAKDPRVVRNWQKIKALRDNVDFMRQEASQHGSFARFLAGWPADDQVGLTNYLKKRGARLGGFSGQYFLRKVGYDAYLLTQDVVRVLRNAGVEIKEQPSGQRELQRVQGAFNHWHRETGLPYAHLSRIAAFSTGENHAVEILKDRIL
jgi:3-methyladenine DNA glycosylase Tag